MDTDLELIDATLSGDKSAFGVLAARYQTQVYRLAYRIISNPFDASDIVQETLLKAYQNLGRLKNKEKFSFWLFQIAKNQCISWIRRYQKNLNAVENELANDRLNLPPAPDEILVNRELRERIMSEISRLPEHSRRAVEMFYIEGRSYAEIQDELGITKGTLGRRLHKAKVQLQKRLREAYLSSVIWARGGLNWIPRLSPRQSGVVTSTAAVSGLKCLMISMMLHVLIFTGMSVTGVNWRNYSNTVNYSLGDSAVDVSLIEVNSPEYISLPLNIAVKQRSRPLIQESDKTFNLADFTPVRRMIPEIRPPRLKSPDSQIARPESEPKILTRRVQAAHVEFINRAFPPQADRAITGLDSVPAIPVNAMKRMFPILTRKPPFRNRSELATPVGVSEPIASQFYDDEFQPKIIFISNRGYRFQSRIYMMNINGTGVEQLDRDNLTVIQGGASASPRERQIVFHTRALSPLVNIGRNYSKGYAICVMGVDSGNIQLLTYGINPTWSPDGKRIAFCRLGSGNSDICVIDRDGSEIPITKNRASNLHPTWSPDGKKIAFSSNMKMDRRIRNIYVMNADGTNPTPLTHINTVGWWSDYPAWSPDGTKIAYAAGKTDRRCRVQSTIFIMDIDGGNRRALVTRAYCPTWSPDGRKIVFCSNRDGNEEIYMIDADGKNLRRLTANHYQDTQPSWLRAGLLD